MLIASWRQIGGCSVDCEDRGTSIVLASFMHSLFGLKQRYRWRRLLTSNSRPQALVFIGWTAARSGDDALQGGLSRREIASVVRTPATAFGRMAVNTAASFCEGALTTKIRLGSGETRSPHRRTAKTVRRCHLNGSTPHKTSIAPRRGWNARLNDVLFENRRSTQNSLPILTVVIGRFPMPSTRKPVLLATMNASSRTAPSPGNSARDVLFATDTT